MSFLSNPFVTKTLPVHLKNVDSWASGPHNREHFNKSFKPVAFNFCVAALSSPKDTLYHYFMKCKKHEIGDEHEECGLYNRKNGAGAKTQLRPTLPAQM